MRPLDLEVGQGSVGLFGTFPVEVIEKILNCVVEDDPYLVNAPVVGVDGVSVDPHVWLSDSKSPTKPQSSAVRNEYLGPSGHENGDQDDLETQRSIDTRTPGNQDLDTIKEKLIGLDLNASKMSGLSALRHLRLTCRYLNSLCNPILYREVDLYLRSNDFNSTAKNDIEQFLLLPYGHYVTTLRIRVINWDRIRAILTACRNLRCLALYLTYGSQYTGYDTDTFNLICDSIVHTLQGGLHSVAGTEGDGGNGQADRGRKRHLTSLGIYSESIVRGLFDRNISTPNSYDSTQRLLESILNVNPSTSSDFDTNPTSSTPSFNADVDGDNTSEVTKLSDTLQVLDLGTDRMVTDTYDQIRSGFKSLRSLTIRRSLHIGLGKIWDPVQRGKWALNTALKHSLRKLYLRDCDSAAAWHVPELVRHFKRLEELVIIACGNDNYVPPRRLAVLSTTSMLEPGSRSGLEDGGDSGGWSTLPDALCNTRPPLRTFHIEHMDEEEVTSMGIIPVHTLSLISRQVVILLRKDREIFPGLKVLRTYPGTKQDPPPMIMTTLTQPVIPANLTEVEHGQGDAENNEGGKVLVDEDKAWKGTASKEERYLRTMLENLCKARGVELRYDLPPSNGCGPDCHYI